MANRQTTHAWTNGVAIWIYKSTCFRNRKNTKMLKMMEQMARKLDVDITGDPSVAFLEEATRPEVLLKQIDESVRRCSSEWMKRGRSLAISYIAKESLPLNILTKLDYLLCSHSFPADWVASALWPFRWSEPQFLFS